MGTIQLSGLGRSFAKTAAVSDINLTIADGEFLVLLGAYKASTVTAFLAATGLVLGAAYMLYLYKRVVFGAPTKADVKAMPDVNCREIATFVPLIALALWMGIYPSSFINPMAPALEKVIVRYDTALADAAKLKLENEAAPAAEVR